MTVNYSTAKSIALVAVQNLGVIDNCSFGNISLNMSGTQGDIHASATFDFSTTPVHTIYIGYSATVGDNQGTVSDCRYDGVSVSVNRKTMASSRRKAAATSADIDGSGVASYGVANLTRCRVEFRGNAVYGRHHRPQLLRRRPRQLLGQPCGRASRISYGTFVGGVAGGSAARSAIVMFSVKLKYRHRQRRPATSKRTAAPAAPCSAVSPAPTPAINATSAENVGLFAEAISNVVYGIAGNNSYQITNCYASGKQSDSNVIVGVLHRRHRRQRVNGTAVSGAMPLSPCPGSLTAGALAATAIHDADLEHWSRAISG